MGGEDLTQRGELVAVLVVLEVEQLDVEVTRLAGDQLDPLQVLAQALELALGEDGLELAQERAGASYGDAQVMQELAVYVVQRAGQVGRRDRVRAGEHGLGGGAGA